MLYERWQTVNIWRTLGKDKSATTHNQNLQTVATEMLIVTKGLAPDTFRVFFNTRNKLNYNMCHALHFDVPLVNYIYNGTESISGTQTLECTTQWDKGNENSGSIQRKVL